MTSKPPTEIQTLIDAHINSFNSHDREGFSRVFGDTAIIIDGIAPYRWLNPNAPARWLDDVEKWRKANGVIPRRGDWVLRLLTAPAVSAFPGMAAGSARASTFSRLVRRSLALQPAHSQLPPSCGSLHRRLQPFRCLHSCSGCFRLEHLAGWDLHPLGKRRLSTAHANSSPSRVIPKFPQSRQSAKA